MIGKILSLLALVAVMQPPFSAAEDQTEGKRLYQSYCIGCHGTSGKGDGPAGKTLPVKPADHTNGKKMSQYSDEHLVNASPREERASVSLPRCRHGAQF